MANLRAGSAGTVTIDGTSTHVSGTELDGPEHATVWARLNAEVFDYESYQRKVSRRLAVVALARPRPDRRPSDGAGRHTTWSSRPPERMTSRGIKAFPVHYRHHPCSPLPTSGRRSRWPCTTRWRWRSRSSCCSSGSRGWRRTSSRTSARTTGGGRPTAGRSPCRGGYDRRDALASMSMGVVSVVTMTLWKLLALVRYAVLFASSRRGTCPLDAWWTWAIAILGVDFFFYLGAPRRAPGAPRLGHPPGAPLQRVLQLRHRAAAEVEQLRRDRRLAAAAPARGAAGPGVPRLLGEPRLPVLRAHRARRQALAAGRARAQHPVPPPGPPRPRPASTSTATTPAS